MARRVHVEWQTEETVDWEADFEVPDEVADDEVEDYFTDGNCATLVEYEGEHPGDGSMMLFERETEIVRWLEGEPERAPDAGEYRIDVRWVIEADSVEDAVSEFRSAISNPRFSLVVTKPDGTAVEA